MCRRYPGRRCGNPIHEKVESLRIQVAEAQALRDSLNPDEISSRDIEKANSKVIDLEAKLKEAQKKYDMSDIGFAALEAEAQDENLTSDERKALKVRLDEAAKARAERFKVVSDAEARKANVIAFLEAAGVPRAEQAEFTDENIYRPATGSAKHYATIKNNRMRAFENRLAEYNRALAAAKTPDEVAKVEATEALAVEKAKSDFNRALHTYDATGEGLEKLRAQVAKAAVCYTVDDVNKRHRLRLRLENAEKEHRSNLDSRNYRNAKLTQLKNIAAAHGCDVAGAVAAFKNKSPLPQSAKRRVAVENMRNGRVHSHLTTRDVEAIDRAFKQSAEYTSNGEAGRARFLERRIMRPPHELYLSESLEEANARVVIASNGKVGRNNTTIEQGTGLTRDKNLTICLTDTQAEYVRSCAAFLNTSVSTYVDDMVQGRNPAANQNDRSAIHRAKKHAKMSEVIRNRVVAA